ncbi:MAG: nitroreductase family protein [Actinobacteria bacterium]|nr:nitroreductase family protein [Actinomycetota bacterium]
MRESAISEPASPEQVAGYVVAEAVWAPSVNNTQPWWFLADGPQISLYADADRGLPAADPDGREMLISCGAALFNARLALRSLGYVPRTRVLPDPGQPALVAQVSWPRRAPVSESERRLASQVRWRRTHRGAFDPEPLPYGLLAVLREGAARDGAALRIVADDGRRAALAAAVQTAEHNLRLDGERVRELARWAPAPDSARRDGVPATSYPAQAERTDPYFPGRDFAHGHGWGVPPLSTARWPRAAGVAGLLTTAADRREDWVSAGQALQRILLTASACGAAVALHSQPMELPRLREFIRTQLSDGAYPHLVLRLGMVTQVAVSVRHDLGDVLFSSGGHASRAGR